jgi:hypothetical protein
MILAYFTDALTILEHQEAIDKTVSKVKDWKLIYLLKINEKGKMESSLK